GLKDRGEGGGAGGEQQRAGAALDRRQHGLGGFHGRVVRAAVTPGARQLVVAVAHIGGRAVHGRHQRAGGVIEDAERLGDAGGDVEVGHGSQRCWYWAAPNRISFALASMGALRTLSAKTLRPRSTAGRAAMASNQRRTFG